MKVQTLLTTGVTACLLAGLGGLAAPAHAQELLTNPGFEDLDMDGSAGDGWGSYGAAGFNAFFGDNAHASLFADNAGNFGGVFQQGIVGSEGLTYSFDLTDVRIESNFDASLRFGLEYYPADDATLISADLVEIFAPGDGMPTGDGLTFSMTTDEVSGRVEAAVFDFSGRRMQVRAFDKGNRTLTDDLDVSNLPKGVYQLVLTSERGVVSRNFVKL